MHQPNPDGSSKPRRRAAFDPLGIDQRNQRIYRDAAPLRRHTQTVPEKGFKADRGLMAIDRNRVFDWWVIRYLHTLNTYAARR